MHVLHYIVNLLIKAIKAAKSPGTDSISPCSRYPSSQGISNFAQHCMIIFFEPCMSQTPHTHIHTHARVGYFYPWTRIRSALFSVAAWFPCTASTGKWSHGVMVKEIWGVVLDQKKTAGVASMSNGSLWNMQAVCCVFWSFVMSVWDGWGWRK